MLHGDRPIHMGGEGEIPFAAIDAAARRFGIENSDDFETFRTLIKRLDVAYLKYRADRAEPTKEGEDG